jgi:hypothetical protein
MDNRIDYNYISNAIDELISLLGIKEDIPVDTITDPLSVGNIKGCIKNIANYLGLPIVVNVSYVPATYQRNGRDRFDTTALATTDGSGRGVEGIVAQVIIPSYLPLYGTLGLQGFPISVKISDNCQRHPVTFMAIMAHELSHIVLHSLLHKEKDNEVYTDLTAMILGFSLVINVGREHVETKSVQTKNYGFFSERVTETLTTRYGYLSDEQFNFAFNKISKILKKHIDSKEKLMKKLTAYKNLLASYEGELFRFHKFVEYLDKNVSKRIKREDGAKIVVFHQVDYAERFRAVIRSNEVKFKEISDFCEGLVHYTLPRLNALQKFDEEIDSLITDLRRDFDLLNDDVNTLRKYVGFFYKRKINQQSTSI